MKKDYSKLLTNPKWQRKRLEIMQRDDFRCVKCKDEETTLNVHHIQYHKDLDPWEYDNDELKTLCVHCHKEIEDLKKTEDVLFEEILIHKSLGWTDGSRIIFIVHGAVCSMTIYNSGGDRINGWDFSNDYDNGRISLMFETAYGNG